MTPSADKPEEDPVKQGVQDSGGTGTEGLRGLPADLRVPRQSRSRDVDRELGTPAAPVSPAARGEHTHGEPSVPDSRPAVQRSSVRGQILDALRHALVTGDLKPGEVYSAPALGER